MSNSGVVIDIHMVSGPLASFTADKLRGGGALPMSSVLDVEEFLASALRESHPIMFLEQGQQDEPAAVRMMAVTQVLAI